VLEADREETLRGMASFSAKCEGRGRKEVSTADGNDK
jgi:hypothetical protein